MKKKPDPYPTFQWKNRILIRLSSDKNRILIRPSSDKKTGSWFDPPVKKTRILIRPSSDKNRILIRPSSDKTRIRVLNSDIGILPGGVGESGEYYINCIGFMSGLEEVFNLSSHLYPAGKRIFFNFFTGKRSRKKEFAPEIISYIINLMFKRYTKPWVVLLASFQVLY